MDTTNTLVHPVISPPNKQRATGNLSATITIPPFNLEERCKKPKRKKQKLGAPKNLWSPREDRILGEEVQKLGEKAWSEIAAKLPGRVGKQCRDRWRNHLCPEVKKGSWTGLEDKLLFEYRDKLGNQWAEIAKHIPGRTDLSVKNRYYSFRRKVQRQERRHQKVKLSSVSSNGVNLQEALSEKGSRRPSDSSRERNKQRSGLSMSQPLTGPGFKSNLPMACCLPSNPFSRIPRKISGLEALPTVRDASATAPLLPLSNAFNTNMLNMNLLALYNMSNGLAANNPDLAPEGSGGINRLGSNFKFNPLDFNTSRYISYENLELLSRNNLGRASMDSLIPEAAPTFLPHNNKRRSMLSANSMYKNPICHVQLTDLKQHFV